MPTMLSPAEFVEKNTMIEDKHNGIAPFPEELETTVTKDLVFGEISERGPNYRNVNSFSKSTCFKVADET